MPWNGSFSFPCPARAQSCCPRIFRGSRDFPFFENSDSIVALLSGSGGAELLIWPRIFQPTFPFCTKRSPLSLKVTTDHSDSLSNQTKCGRPKVGLLYSSGDFYFFWQVVESPLSSFSSYSGASVWNEDGVNWTFWMDQWEMSSWRDDTKRLRKCESSLWKNPISFDDWRTERYWNWYPWLYKLELEITKAHNSQGRRRENQSTK